jgi:omega-6 fatty acid desaturase / acyl-lipid omega-6 desaturase (Delta-12 desaturase)
MSRNENWSQLVGWPMHLIRNATGQWRYPSGSNRAYNGVDMVISVMTPHPDFDPNAVMFAPHQFGQVIISDVGVLLWIGALAAWIYQSGFSQVFRLYLVPYLW